jgi:hypothetical protein
MRRRCVFIPPPQPDVVTRQRQVTGCGERAVSTAENSDPHKASRRFGSDGSDGSDGAILPNGQPPSGFRPSSVTVKRFKCKAVSVGSQRSRA